MIYKAMGLASVVEDIEFDNVSYVLIAPLLDKMWALIQRKKCPPAASTTAGLIGFANVSCVAVIGGRYHVTLLVC